MRNNKKRYVGKITRSQRGVALITVLLIFSISTLIASKIIINKVIDVKRTTGLLNRTQAYYYALAAEELAILALKNDYEEDLILQSKNTTNADHLDENWAMGPYSYEIDNIGSTNVKIIDLNRFYNLNNFITHDNKINIYEVERFRDLLVALDLDPILADNLRDWVDFDNDVVGDNSERDSYLNGKSGYLVANQGLNDVSELRLIKGFTSEVLEKLLPHVSVIPIKIKGIVPLNINTATEFALQTLQKSGVGSQSSNNLGISYNEAQDIVIGRDPFYAQASEIIQKGIINNLQLNSKMDVSSSVPSGISLSTVSTHSSYFEINIIANYAGSVAYLSTIVRASGSSSDIKFDVLSRRELDNTVRFL
jgi:type II secretory pathway component PulK